MTIHQITEAIVGDDPVKLPAGFSRSDPLYWNRLYRQKKDGIFTDVTQRVRHQLRHGVATGDYDNDG